MHLPHRTNKRNVKKRKKHTTKDDQNSNKKFRDKINIKSEDRICLLSDDNEQDANDCRSNKEIKHDVENRTTNDDEDVIELTNEPNLEGNSIESGIVF